MRLVPCPFLGPLICNETSDGLSSTPQCVDAGLGRCRFRTRPRWKDNSTFKYESRRWALIGAPAAFSATYRGEGDERAPAPGTLEHFLTERYSSYSSDGTRIWRADIHHPRWRLQPGEAFIDTNSMLAAAGLRASQDSPLLHFAGFQEVRFWWPTRVR